MLWECQAPIAIIFPLGYPTPMKYETAIAFFLTHSALAKALGVKRQAIDQWRVKGKIPILRAYQLQKLTNGKVKADLSIYEPEPRENGHDSAPVSR